MGLEHVIGPGTFPEDEQQRFLKMGPGLRLEVVDDLCHLGTFAQFQLLAVPPWQQEIGGLAVEQMQQR